MPWSGTGTFTRGYSWVADAAAALDISSSRMDADTNDIVGNGLNNCLTRDGQGVPTADLPMNSKKHTGVADATSRSNYPSVGQIQDNKLIFVAAGGTADALTATFTPATTALVDGEQHCIRALLANATTTPTYAPDGLTAHTITRYGGAALVAGDIVGVGHELILRYNLANTRWELLNPANPKTGATINSPTINSPNCSGTTSAPGLFQSVGSSAALNNSFTNVLSIGIGVVANNQSYRVVAWIQGVTNVTASCDVMFTNGVANLSNAVNSGGGLTMNNNGGSGALLINYTGSGTVQYAIQRQG